MQGRLAFHAAEIRVYGDARNPGEPVAGENQRPRIAVLPRNARIDQDVLQLARAPSAGGSHPQPGAAESEPDVQVCPQVSDIGIAAPVTGLHVELRSAAGLLRTVDLHEVAHDTETPAARQIYTPASAAAGRQPQDRVHVRA